VPGLGDTTIGGDERPAANVPTRLERGAQVGRYVVLQQLGRGGMGVVYAAFDPQLDRKVALKLLHVQPHETLDGGGGPSRLQREALALAKLTHPNVITIHDVGTHEGAVFLAMEFIDGQTLGDWAETRRPWREVIAMFVAAGRGIAAAHGAGIVHRDFKPDNVMIGKDGRPRVLDFGLARAAETGDVARSPVDPALDVPLTISSTLDTKLTVTGAVMGTPAYMAPEQHFGRAVDERSDQFAFCVSLYEALYGERPFAGDNLAALAFAVTEGKVREAPSGSAVPTWLRRVLLRGLAREPAERWPSMDELLRELGRDPTRTRRLVLVGVGLLGAVIGLGVLGQQLLAEPQLCTGAEEHMVGVWDPETRAALHDAFRATGAVYADDAFRTFAAMLDDYAEQWITMHGEACTATRIRGDQSDEALTLRMACLDRGRAQLSALVEVYRTADAQALERSFQAAESLPPLRSCADVEALTLGVRPPETKAQRQQVDAVQPDLDAARSLGQAGHTAESLERLRALLPAVEATEYRPLIAEAELARGMVLEDAEQQIAALQRAIWMAEVSRHDRVAAEAWITLVRAYGAGVNDFDRALDSVARADAAIERLGGDPELRIRLDVAHGTVLTSMQRNDEAVVVQRRARAARIAAGQGNTPTALNEVVALANALMSVGEIEAAQQVLVEAIAQGEEVLGDDHPWQAKLRTTLGRVFYTRRDYARAEVEMRAALRVFERAHGEDSANVTAALNGLALVLDQQRRFDEALALYQRALTNVRANNGPRHANAGKILHNMGLVHLELGDYAKALAHVEEALAIKREVYGPSSVEVARAHDDVARALHGLGRDSEAAVHARAAVDLFAALDTPDDTGTVETWTTLAIVEIGLGHGDAALHLFELADARIAQSTPEEIGRHVVARHAFEYAQLLWTRGEHDEARSLAEQSAQHYEQSGNYYQPERDEVAAWLAERSPTR
jgi:tetratricopeptide (TPR) repeat protein/tRNA A-37 threonylcarbamoyl transferase component Bud32